MSSGAGPVAVETIWRMESARLIAALARFTGDIGLAEDLAQDALVAALDQWPTKGIPPNPGGWLMTTAKNAAVDGFRRDGVHRRSVETIGRMSLGDGELGDDPAEVVARLDDPVGDDELRLLFAACHPVLNRDYRVALTLRCLAGLTTREIARALLVPEQVVGQRISRAKSTLRAKQIALDMPSEDDIRTRLGTVMEVVYLLFNEGYAATAGEDWMRHDLSSEALRLARRLAQLTPGAAEAHGLQALLELTQARAAARLAPDGTPVLLQDQDRSRWDRLLIGRGLAALERARRLGEAGPYVLQAAIAACHATAVPAPETDWHRIAGLYDVLSQQWPNPVVQVNRAMAHGHASGADAGLAVLASVDTSGLADYPQRAAVEGELLAMAGRHDAAAAAFEQAANLTRNGAERRLLTERANSARSRGVSGNASSSPS